MTTHLGQRPALDGVRALAIILVIVFHSGCPFLAGGFVGVDVFFVLSGFLITTILATEIQQSGTIHYGNFFARRLLRLVPALALLLSVYLLAASRGSNFRHHLTDAGLAIYLADFSRAWGWYGGGRPGLLGHTWSLAIEEQFYLVWPWALLLLFRVVRRPGNRIALVAILAASLAAWRAVLFLGLGASFERVYNAPDTHADGLLIGCAVGLAFTAGRLTASASVGRWAPPAAILGLLALSIAGNEAAAWMVSFGGLLASLMAAALIIALVCRPESLAARLFALAPVVYLGKVSYALYLWHHPVMKLFTERNYSWVATLAFGGGISLLAATASYRFVERPFLSMKRRFETRVG